MVSVAVPMIKGYSNRQAAKRIGIGWQTLVRWIEQGKVKAPPVGRVGGVKVRFWTERDIARVRKQMKALYHPKMVRSKAS